MATNENNVKCEGCIHLGHDGRCWQGVTNRKTCHKRMTLAQALNPQGVEQAARDYADKVLQRTDPEFAAQDYARRDKMRAVMFDGNDLQDAFDAGATWRGQHSDK